MTKLTRTLQNGLRRARTTVARFRDENAGVAAIEFALIAPIMVVLYIGLYQISFIIQTDRNVSHATSVMGDLTTRVANIDEAGVADVMQAAVEVLAVSNTITLQNDIEMDISSYRMDAGGNIERIGYAQTNNANFPPIDTSTLTSQMLNAQIGTVIARVRYDYQMMSNATSTEIDGANDERYIGKNGILLAEQFVMRPRVSNEIVFGEDPVNTETYTCAISASRVVTCS